MYYKWSRLCFDNYFFIILKLIFELVAFTTKRPFLADLHAFLRRQYVNFLNSSQPKYAVQFYCFIIPGIYTSFVVPLEWKLSVPVQWWDAKIFAAVSAGLVHSSSATRSSLRGCLRYVWMHKQYRRHWGNTRSWLHTLSMKYHETGSWSYCQQKQRCSSLR